jgi:predicted alpha-1,2-mannosidase
MKAIIISLTIILFSCTSSEDAPKLIEYVDPFIGTKGEGNTFPGAALPFGMVKLGPDSGNKLSNSGFKSDSVIHGFSHTHVSGTGGGPKYGNVLVMPFTGDFELGKISSLPQNYNASPGYFAVDLEKYKIRAELSCSKRAGFHKYTFQDSGKKGILIDAGSFLGKGFCCGEEQQLVASEINIVSENRIEGYTSVRGGWNKGDVYTVYFSASFDTPASSFGIWNDDKTEHGSRISKSKGQQTGAYFHFENTKSDIINVKVGISFLSVERALMNLNDDINHWDFNLVRKNAEDKWNDALKSIYVADKNRELKTIFYTALYHTMLMPTDRTGENPLWTSGNPYYDDYYAIWDTYRATHPLMTLIQKDRQIEMINTLIDIYENEGFMPDARSGNYSGRTQGGSNCDVMIADAFSKGLDGIDYEKALESMIKNAEIPPEEDHQKFGRGGILEYNTLGYVSTNHERAGTRTVEYAYNDYCIYLVAEGLGRSTAAAKYLERSGNWKNLWKQVTDSGAQGFIMPKSASGKWADDFMGRAWDPVKDWYPVEFTVHTAGTWSDFFYEADSWEYSFYVPHDVNGLINKCGGRNAFIDRLDTFFKENYYNVGNEPSFFTPCLYTYAGKQHKTNSTIRNILEEYYTAEHDGIPGNDDAGSMSAWAVFNLMGFYPNAGQDVYILTSPHFKELTLRLNEKKDLKIVSHNLNSENIYIEKVVLNGKDLNRAWFRHSEIEHGGKLEFFMASEPDNSWEEVLPPSLGNVSTK